MAAVQEFQIYGCRLTMGYRASKIVINTKRNKAQYHWMWMASLQGGARLDKEGKLSFNQLVATIVPITARSATNQRPDSGHVTDV